MKIIHMIVEKIKKKRGDPQRSPEEQKKIDDEVLNEWLRLFEKHMREHSQVQHDTHGES